jgi:N-acetylmuramoyl-L-alanine amidase
MAKIHIVEQGECLTRIAARYGFTDWRTLYHHPENAPLRTLRPNPNVLFPGDAIRIPDNRVKEEALPTGNLHRFVVHAPRKLLRIVFKHPDGRPFDNEPYELTFPNKPAKRAKTNAQGLLEEPVALHALQATLTIAGRTLALQLGHLNPNGDVEADDLTGIQGRLHNLGYATGPIDGLYGRNTRAALALLQADEQLDINGLPDEPTLAQLEALHGC